LAKAEGLLALFLLQKIYSVAAEWSLPEPQLKRTAGKDSPMETVDLTHARERLAELLGRAARGEDVRIADPAIGIVRLTPVAPRSDRVIDALPPFVPLATPRVPGRLEGKIKVPGDILAPMSQEELADWYPEDT
jgi:antitoxin (DNA-binding transcriptional repressor) of toxin-antitoxin stability system